MKMQETEAPIWTLKPHLKPKSLYFRCKLSYQAFIFKDRQHKQTLSKTVVTS